MQAYECGNCECRRQKMMVKNSQNVSILTLYKILVPGFRVKTAQVFILDCWACLYVSMMSALPPTTPHLHRTYLICFMLLWDIAIIMNLIWNRKCKKCFEYLVEMMILKKNFHKNNYQSLLLLTILNHYYKELLSK